MIDDLGPAWIAEPSVYDNIEGCDRLTANLKTPIQVGEKFYGPRALYSALQMKARSSARTQRLCVNRDAKWTMSHPWRSQRWSTPRRT